MDKEKYIDDIREIKEIMDKSSRFISLSGWSGIFSGLVALLGAYLAYSIVYSTASVAESGHFIIDSQKTAILLQIAVATLVLAIIGAIVLTRLEVKQKQQKIWDHQTQRLIVNLLIPLAIGGICCLVLLLQGFTHIVAPLSLVFYGISLVNASKYTVSEIRSLGLLESGLGIIALAMPGYGLYFWAAGFGVLHVIYGLIMLLRKS